jgi:hypothetical protein
MVRFGEALPNSGVDNTSRWMMVPVRDNVRYVVLTDGAGLTVGGFQLDIREITGSGHGVDLNLISLIRARNPNARVFTVTGLTAGDTTIYAKDARGRTLATMDVTVKKKVELKVAFHLVKRKTKGQAPKIAVADIDKLVTLAGYKLGTQANVWIRKHLAQSVVAGDADTVCKKEGKSCEPGSTWWDLVKLGDRTADANVFFVDVLGVDDASGVRSSLGLTVGTNSVIPNKESLDKYARTLVHEIIHVLGIPAEEHRHGDLDHIFGDQGTKIPKDFVNRINP